MLGAILLDVVSHSFGHYGFGHYSFECHLNLSTFIPEQYSLPLFRCPIQVLLSLCHVYVLVYVVLFSETESSFLWWEVLLRICNLSNVVNYKVWEVANPRCCKSWVQMVQGTIYPQDPSESRWYQFGSSRFSKLSVQASTATCRMAVDHDESYSLAFSSLCFGTSTPLHSLHPLAFNGLW